MGSRVLSYWAQLVQDSPLEPILYPPDCSLVTRSSLDAASDELLERWQAAGLVGRRVLVLNLPNGTGWLAAFLACQKLDAVAVSIDPGISQEEALSICEDIRAQAIWNGEDGGLRMFESSKVFRNQKISLAKLTSGSTGKPKILYFSDDEMIADAMQIVRCMKIRPDDINMAVIPWGHSYGLGNIVYPLLLQGTAAAWTKIPYPSEIGSVCERVGCTVFPLVPTLARAFVRSGVETTELKSLRLVVSAGAKMNPELAQAFLDRFGKRIHNFYGSSETGGVCFDESGDATLSGQSIGKPIKDVSIYEGRGDRFTVRSPAVYTFGNRRVSQDGNGEALMADYGSLDSTGELVLQSRAKNLIKIGGRRINPLDIERRLRGIEGVEEAIAFAMDREGDAVIAAAIESSLDRKTLSSFIKEALPLRLRPKRWLVYEKLPVNSRGKVQLQKIRVDFN